MLSKNASTNIKDNKGVVNVNHYDGTNRRLPSIISRVVLHLSRIIDEQASPPLNFTTYEIDGKITHNNLIKYRSLVEDFGEYGYMVNSAYETLDGEKPNSTQRFLKYVNVSYKEVLAELLKANADLKLPQIDIVRANADLIMDNVKNDLRSKYVENTIDEGVTVEELEICLMYIVSKAFIDCKILERPQ